MPTGAKLYAYAVVAAGAITVAIAATPWSCQSQMRFLAALCLAVLASTFKVKLPGMEGCIAPSSVPLLFAAGSHRLVSGIIQTLWKPKGRPQAVQVFFNGTNLDSAWESHLPSPTP